MEKSERKETNLLEFDGLDGLDTDATVDLARDDGGGNVHAAADTVGDGKSSVTEDEGENEEKKRKKDARLVVVRGEPVVLGELVDLTKEESSVTG
jgi:hypothetical protein